LKKLKTPPPGRRGQESFTKENPHSHGGIDQVAVAVALEEQRRTMALEEGFEIGGHLLRRQVHAEAHREA
jgi:hypothetical protein